MEAWIKQDDNRKAAIKCKIIIVLCDGISMTGLCRMFNITREGTRTWRNLVVSKGHQGLVEHGRKGRESRLTPSLRKLLKKIISDSSNEIWCKNPKWNGNLPVQYLQKEHNVGISIRTARSWIKKIKNQ